MFVVTGLVSASPSPRCDGLLYSGQPSVQIYSPVCGLAQRLFSAQSLQWSPVTVMFEITGNIAVTLDP